ncbi:tryptophan transporter [Peribacillus asahii]|uniref:Tryptophan transporter n=1 Tax=Peribacillus asahii TaxID=228899 RepID=A0A3T0KMI9_9BACI|nr:tryptophan transporter [Peribacillus asahii]AZV41612.1 tryptophan transporter [Peribacillus asahii]USK85964.1 tryptophan transporter [Peribacillus asahii]
MNTKTLVSIAMLLGIGTALHFIIPGYLLMKPDMMLLMMFLAIALFPEKKNVFVIALGCGLLSAITTSFPGGYIPNIIDKFVTAFLFYFLIVTFKKLSTNVAGLVGLTVIGTLISGVVFLGSAYLIVGLPKSFVLLVGGVVVPAMAANAIVMAIIYPIIAKILKKTSIPSASVEA